jgi:phosphatidylinositol-3-phosphatase
VEFLTILVLALAFSNSLGPTTTGTLTNANHSFNYVVVIVMENHGLGDIINNTSAPFMNQLASSYSLATNYTAVNHPSLPNYLSLISGQDFAAWSKTDCSPGPGCSAGSSLNIVDSLESRGLSWKAYMEDYPGSCASQCSPGNCFLGDAGTYAARHDPFVYFDDIVNSTSRCSRIVPANSVRNGPDDVLLSDLSSPSTASNFMWLTPNLCNDVHDCPISTGDNYLSRVVPSILNSTLFRHQKAALFITFDEGNGDFPNDQVYSVWAGPVVKTHFESSNQYSHYSLLKTLETVWKLGPLTNNDRNAAPMTAFFVSPAHHGRGEHKVPNEKHELRHSDFEESTGAPTRERPEHDLSD